MNELICIVCPRGCRITVEQNGGEYTVKGNACKRGINYGISETTSPVRTITSTVIIQGALHRRLPVKTDIPVPKNKIFEIMSRLNSIKLQSPVKEGQIIIENILNTGANIISTREM